MHRTATPSLLAPYCPPAGTLLPRSHCCHHYCRVALLAGWFPSPSLPATRFTLPSQLVLVMVFHCIALSPWMFLKSGARRFPRSSPVTRLAPKPVGSGNSPSQQATVVLFFPLRRPLAVRFFSFVWGSLLKGFLSSCTSSCWVSSRLAFLFFPPH